MNTKFILITLIVYAIPASAMENSSYTHMKELNPSHDPVVSSNLPDNGSPTTIWRYVTFEQLSYPNSPTKELNADNDEIVNSTTTGKGNQPRRSTSPIVCIQPAKNDSKNIWKLATLDQIAHAERIKKDDLLYQLLPGCIVLGQRVTQQN
jgi:hypothetical protein